MMGRLTAVVLCVLLSSQVAVSQSVGAELWKGIAKGYEKEPPKPGKADYSSVCARNAEKFASIKMNTTDPKVAFATYDIVLINVFAEYNKMFQPCIGYDEDMKQRYDDNVKEITRVRNYCAGSHPSYQCTEWGSEPGNKGYFENLQRVIQNIVSNPNYSADLGTAYAPGSNMPQPGSNEPPEEKACKAALRQLSDAQDAENQKPTREIIRPFEIAMGTAKASVDVIDKQCPNSAKYKRERADFLKAFDDMKKTCDAMASRACQPRLN